MGRELHHRQSDDTYALWSTISDEYITPFSSYNVIRNYWIAELIQDSIEKVDKYMKNIDVEIEDDDNEDIDINNESFDTSVLNMDISTDNLFDENKDLSTYFDLSKDNIIVKYIDIIRKLNSNIKTYIDNYGDPAIIYRNMTIDFFSDIKKLNNISKHTVFKELLYKFTSEFNYKNFLIDDLYVITLKSKAKDIDHYIYQYGFNYVLRYNKWRQD